MAALMNNALGCQQWVMGFDRFTRTCSWSFFNAKRTGCCLKSGVFNFSPWTPFILTV